MTCVANSKSVTAECRRGPQLLGSTEAHVHAEQTADDHQRVAIWIRVSPKKAYLIWLIGRSQCSRITSVPRACVRASLSAPVSQGERSSGKHGRCGSRRAGPSRSLGGELCLDGIVAPTDSPDHSSDTRHEHLVKRIGMVGGLTENSIHQAVPSVIRAEPMPTRPRVPLSS